jgi:hypothetical protein
MASHCYTSQQINTYGNQSSHNRLNRFILLKDYFEPSHCSTATEFHPMTRGRDEPLKIPESPLYPYSRCSRMGSLQTAEVVSGSLRLPPTHTRPRRRIQHCSVVGVSQAIVSTDLVFAVFFSNMHPVSNIIRTLLPQQHEVGNESNAPVESASIPRKYRSVDNRV